MNRLKGLRKQKGLTLRDLESLTGISKQRLSRYENYKREPKIETWEKIADALDVSTSYLTGLSNWPIPYQDNEKCEDFMIYLKDGQELMIWDTFNNLLSKMQTKKAFVVKTSEDDKYIVNPSNILWIGD